jgi:hypothetical protein
MEQATTQGSPRARRHREGGGSILLALTLGVLALLGWPEDSTAQSAQPRVLLPGLEWIQWDGGEACKSGDTAIAVLVVDPERFRFRNFHYRREGEKEPLGIEEWEDRTSAPVLLNSGQYYPDYKYMGLLIADGKPIGHKLHPLFRGLFLAEPVVPSAPKARILDLSKDPFDGEDPGYLQIAQSFMLLDRDGSIRVQKTLNVANRTVLAEGHDARIWIFVTRGGYTLWEFAQLLLRSSFPIRQAMSMDGGDESQLMVNVPGFHYSSLGSSQPADSSGRSAPLLFRRPLPAVIGVFPRKP